MGKSILNALFGIRVAQGKVAVDDPVFAPEWGSECRDGGGDGVPAGTGGDGWHAAADAGDGGHAAADARQALTVDHMLRMSSGLAFVEDYSKLRVSDPVTMLFIRPDAAMYAASMPLEHGIDTHWAYSSGTTNILSRHLRASFEVPQARATAACAGHWSEEATRLYLSFPRTDLFDRIGMRGAVLEADAEGDFVLSSFDAATALDWARFGLLYLLDGQWPADSAEPPAERDTGTTVPPIDDYVAVPSRPLARVLPEGWVQYSATPTPQAPEGRYGAHWWLNAGDPAGSRTHPRLPADTMMAHGFQEQVVMVIPSEDLVLVRLGNSMLPTDWDEEEFGARVIAALHPQGTHA